jgi:hypothetical protein
MDWDQFLVSVQTDPSFPISALFLQAIADVTNYHIFVVTSMIGDRYILDVLPRTVSMDRRSSGQMKLAHWNYTEWAPLRDSPDTHTYVTPGVESHILSQADDLIQVLQSLNPIQSADLSLPASLRSAIQDWISLRTDSNFARQNYVFAMGSGTHGALGVGTTFR